MYVRYSSNHYYSNFLRFIKTVLAIHILLVLEFSCIISIHIYFNIVCSIRQLRLELFSLCKEWLGVIVYSGNSFFYELNPL